MFRVFSDLASTVELETTCCHGTVLRFRTDEPTARLAFELGPIADFKKAVFLNRNEPYWVIPGATTDLSTVPVETQFLLAERTDGSFVAVVPLICETFRASLQGGEAGLELLVESGDAAVVETSFPMLYVHEGTDPYRLVEEAAEAVCGWLGTTRLRKDKPVPDFVDLFGWCTWDAFYQEVSHDKVREGLESFAAGGVQPRLLILDDGWQSVRKHHVDSQRLHAFHANEKFPGDVGATVRMAKNEFGVARFLVWHAFQGYWGGVEMPGYGVMEMERRSSPGIEKVSPFISTWVRAVGVVPPAHIHCFYNDYHGYLRRQGVDGVKVDNQASAELTGYGFGGRVKFMKAYREALEGSVQTQFQGRIINCMSMSMDMLYHAPSTTVTRTSTDFWPNRPETHGLHLATNALASFWFGQFVHPDWDMFQSGHAMGAFHAAGRAVSGGPVYVSDKPGSHDFDLLKQTALPDGRVLRGQTPGLPTRDCLMTDPTEEDVLLKIFTRNAANVTVGVFNCRYREGGEGAVSGSMRPEHVPGCEIGEYILRCFRSGRWVRLASDQGLDLELKDGDWQLFTLAPIEDGLAVLGMASQMNGGGSVVSRRKRGSRTVLETACAGEHLVWVGERTVTVAVDGEPVSVAVSDGFVTIPTVDPATIEIS